MGRLIVIVIVGIICMVVAAVLYSALASTAQSAKSSLRKMTGTGEGTLMAPSGIQKTAYIALIVVLFGTASGWLGGL